MEATCIKPYLEYIVSFDLKAYFTDNAQIKPYLNLFYNRGIKTVEQMLNEINNSE